MQEGEPTPTIPIRIRNVGENESVDIRIENKNKLKVNNVEETTKNGVTYSVKENIFSINGTCTSGFNLLTLLTNYLQIETYTLSMKILSGEISNVNNFGCQLVTTNSQNVYFQNTTLNQSIVDNIDKVHTDLRIQMWVGGNITYNNLKVAIQLEKGDKATEYEQHQEQIASLPLEEGQLLHKGDYLAEDGIHQVRKTLILDGTETDISLNTTSSETQINTISFRKNIKGLNVEELPLCSHFKGQKTEGSWNVDTECIWMNTNKYLYFRINRARLETEDLVGFKKYLAEQYANGKPITIECELAEEIIIPYTEEQQTAYNKIKELYSYTGTTHINCIDEISCNFDVTYRKDFTISQDNLQKQIDEIKASLVSEVVE